MSTVRLLLVSLLVLIARPGGAGADDLLLAVASNFIDPAERLAERFEAHTGQRVRISSGSTVRLYTQIRQGAPFDVFMAADQAHPDRLVAEGLAVEAGRIAFARGRLALAWSGTAASDEDCPALERLAEGDYLTLALPDPDVAPYGGAAREVLDRTGHRVPRQIEAHSAAQTWAVLVTGNADLAFVSLSHAREGDTEDTCHIVIPADWHAPLDQVAVGLAGSRHSDSAQAWLTYLASEEARAIIAGYGYEAAP